MRIAIDARPALDPRRTGVGHYTRALIRHLPAADPLPEYVAWYLHARGLFRRRRLFRDAPSNLTEHASRFPARVFQPVSWRLGVPRLEWLLAFDALLATNFLPPATASSGVVLVVHDLAYERFPETAPQIDARWRRRFERWLRRSAAVIVPSQSAKADLLSSHEVDPGRLHVIPHGVERFERPPSDQLARVRERFGIRGPYLLFVGGIEPRKNLLGLVEAYRRLDVEASLVIAGGPVRWFPEAATALRSAVEALPRTIRDRVVVTGYVSDRDRTALLAGARILAYPSLYEGFGLPVLEAFAAGVPVLTSSTSSLPEVAGDAALLVDPLDPNRIAEGIERLLGDRSLCERLRRSGEVRAGAYTWEQTAGRTADVLKAAATRRPGRDRVRG